MDIHEYLGVLRRGLVFIVLGVLLGLGGGFVVQSMQSPSYAATSRDLVTNKTNGGLAEWLQASDFTESRIASYVLVASSSIVLQPVIDELHLDGTVEDLARRITVTAPPATFIIEITATADTPEEARDIANAVSAEFADVVSNRLETTDGSIIAGATPTPGATAGATAAATPKPSPSTTKLPNGTVVPITKPIAPVRIVNIEEAALPEAPLPSNSGLMLLIGGVLGLAAGLVAASLREAFDTRVRGPKGVAAVSPIPVVGDIPRDRSIPANPLVARAGNAGAAAEAFRALRAHVDFVRLRDGRTSFILTGAGHGHGTTTVTANLAVALANTATSIVVVDADLRSSALSRLFGIHDALGLTEVLAGRVILDAALRPEVAGGVTVLPAGARPANSGELLATPAMRDLLADLRSRFDVVLVDAPAVAEVTDAAVLGSFDSATLLVLADGATTRARLDGALSQLAAAGSAPVGIVFTGAPRRARRRTDSRASRRDAVAAPVYAPAYAGAAGAARAGAGAGALSGDALRADAGAPRADGLGADAVRADEEISAPRRASGAQSRRVAAESSSALTGVAPYAPVEAPTPAARPVEPPAEPRPRNAAPAHLSDPIPQPGTGLAVVRPRNAHRRVTAPAGSAALPSGAAEHPAPATPTTRADEEIPPTRGVSALNSRRVARESSSATAAPRPAPAPTTAAPELAPASELAPAPGPAPASELAPAPAPAPAPALAPAPAPAPAPDGAAEPELAAAPEPFMTGELVTDVEHTIGTARALDSAFAALPRATGATPPKLVERPIVVKPDPPKPESRFAPDPSRLAGGAYASAPAPRPGTQNTVPEVKGTVVNTVSIRVQRDVVEAATVPPPIRHILPRPGSTIPPRAVPAPRTPEPRALETAPPAPETADELETRAIPVAGSLLGEIGGLPRVEVRAARHPAATDTAPNPEREARESYEQRARELERVAHERLMREQRRLAVDIREQLAQDKRELESVLDNRLEDTVLRPRRGE